MRLIRFLHSDTTQQRATRFASFGAAGAAFALAGCSGPLSALDAAGPAAESIATMWWVMLAGSGALFALVLALLIAAFLKPGAGAATSPHLWLTGGGLVLPAFVLIPLLAYALWGGERLLARPGDAVRVDVEARRWHWTFTYPNAPGGPVVSTNVMHIPAGATVELRVTSADVIHSFWVPRLAGKIDAIPGHNTTLTLSAPQPGVYRGVCAEFCGTGHTTMEFIVEAHPRADYAELLARLQSPPETAR